MLKRTKNPMPKLVRDALNAEGLMEAYKARPQYQQNDYLGWINRAVREETREKRLKQMLDELARGNRYMNMVYNAKK